MSHLKKMSIPGLRIDSPAPRIEPSAQVTQLQNELKRLNAIQQQPSNKAVVIPKSDTMPLNNTLLICCDQLVSYHLLPDRVLQNLPGYNAFRKLGIEFTHHYNNRSTCTASRAVMLSGMIDTKVQDSMNSKYQNDIVDRLDPNCDTIGKVFKQNGYHTRYIGKMHLDARFYSNGVAPDWFTNATGCMRSYGFDVMDKWGEIDVNGKGMMQDAMSLQYFDLPSEAIYDFYDPVTETKQSGILPYLRACKAQNKRFMCYLNFVNPHDTQESLANLAQTGMTNKMHQFYYPFCQEQSDELQIQSPYIFDENFTDAYIKNDTLVKNFFEQNYNDYKTLIDLLQNPDSYLYDYQSEPTGDPNPYNIAAHEYYKSFSGSANDSSDIKSWKNYLNNYYCLVIECDSYILKVYKELEKLNLLDKTNVIITADHGEQLGAHGLRCKGYIYNENINIPFLVCSPNIDASLMGTKSDYLCCSVDIIPTLMDLANISYTSNQFVGTSVFNKVANNILVPKSRITNPKQSVIHFMGGNDSISTYFLYKIWELENLAEPFVKNIYEHPYMHVNVQTIVNKKLYKYGRYISLHDILDYTTKRYKMQFTKQQLIENAYNSESAADFLSNLPSTTTTYPKIYAFLLKKLKDSNLDLNNNLLINIFLSILKIVDDTTQLFYFIPGCYDNFSKNKKNYSENMFCFNLTNDKDELTNMLDSTNYNTKFDPLFETLNASLNATLETQKMNPFFFISPYYVLIDIYNSIKNSISIDYSALKDQIINVIITNSLSSFPGIYL